MIDSHCHLAGAEFTADLPAVVERARAAGVTQALVILAAGDADELARAATVTAAWAEVRFAIGIHPHAAGAYGTDPDGATGVVEAALAAQPLARALGEVGLDYHYDFAPPEAQRVVFRAQIRVARRRRLPIVIHTREAEDDTFQILTDEVAGDVGGVFHCFTGDRGMAKRALDLGFYLSLAGIVSFANARELREVAAMVPIDRLLIETDSPYLAPVPHRGKRNEPAYVTHVADAIASVRGVGADVVVSAARANFQRLFAP